MDNMTVWQQENGTLPAEAKSPVQISDYALQLSKKDKAQLVAAFESQHYEMAVSYLWGKTITALKKELATVGVRLLGEMLGKLGVDEDDDVDDILTVKDTIRLAEELGIVSPTDGLRLRHTYELITHFSQMDSLESDAEDIDESEAISSLKACVKGVLGRPKIEVAKKFVDFREALEGATLVDDDPRVVMLKSSPYFFYKLTISVLMSAAKKNAGANLEHALANINVVVPAIWPNLRDTEKWQIGHTYAEAYADGKTTVVSGLKSALLKVKGFDFVPENLRSDAFVKAAEAIIKAHEGLNNFYNEASPVKNLAKLGTTIPTPALPVCISALLCVVLGNSYGVAWSAEEEASQMLNRLSQERWSYYLNNVFPGDIRVMSKLTSDKPLERWMDFAEQHGFQDVELKNATVNQLIRASSEKDLSKTGRTAVRLLNEYYGRTQA